MHAYNVCSSAEKASKNLLMGNSLAYSVLILSKGWGGGARGDVSNINIILH